MRYGLKANDTSKIMLVKAITPAHCSVRKSTYIHHVLYFHGSMKAAFVGGVTNHMGELLPIWHA